MDAPRSVNRGYGQEPLPSLKDRALATRPRAVLEAILSTTSSTLELGVTATLNELEQQLFKLAEQAHTNEMQNRCFEALREVRRARADVVPRFMLRVEAALATIADEPVAPEFMRLSRGGRAELALVDPVELEQALALQEVAGKAEIRNSSALFLLGQRFGVLGGMPAFDAEKLPVGPHRLCECLAEAARCIDLEVEHRLLLFRVFDRQCMPVLHALYDQLNALCVRERVLPNLQVHAMFKRVVPKDPSEPVSNEPHATSPRRRDDAPPETGFALGSPDAVSRRDAGARGARAPGPGRAPPEPAASDEPASRGESQDDQGARRVSTPFGVVQSGWPGTPPPYQPERRPARDDKPDARELELFDTLRDLLAGRRAASGDPPAGPNAHEPRPEELQSVLAHLQSRPSPPIMMGGRLVQRSVAHLRQDVLNQLRHVVPDGKQPKLREADSDTMELVGMLFEHLARDHKPALPVQELLTRLQVPLLRVALNDRTFFTRRAHPARQLLNMLAEAGVFWFGDEAEDKPLLDKMRLVVERVTQEYDEDLGIFDELAGDFSKHLGTLARKSDLAERRHVDAVKGREKLEVARATASRAVADTMRQRKPPALVRTLLEQAWTDVLALTLLRQGESSDVYRRRLAVADRLIDATLAGGAGSPAPADAEALQHEIETGLSQVGYHVDEVRSVVGRFFGASGLSAANEEAASATELAMKLKARARLGGDAASEGARRDARARIHPPLEAAELDLLERLKSLPFGTWFEFEANQQGDRVRRKLSWFSPLTGRCLFVNQRGARVEEKTLEQLAREMSRKRASVVEAPSESMIDRAWNAIVTSLKSMAGGGAAPKPA